MKLTDSQVKRIYLAFSLMVDAQGVQTEASAQQFAHHSAIEYGYVAGTPSYNNYVEATLGGWKMLKGYLGNAEGEITWPVYLGFISHQMELAINSSDYGFFDAVAESFFVRLVGNLDGFLTAEQYGTMRRADSTWTPSWHQDWETIMRGRPGTWEVIKQEHRNYWFDPEDHPLMGPLPTTVPA